MKTAMIIGVAIILLLAISVIVLASIISKKKKEIECIKANFEKEKIEINSKHAGEIAATKKNCETQIQQVRLQCEMQIRKVKEQIESRKEILTNMDEKELLASVMVALDGYAGRFDRIESKLTDDQIVQRVTNLTKDFTEKLNGIFASLTEQISSMNSSLEETLNGSDIMEKLQSIDYDVNEIKQSVCDSYAVNSLSSTIEEVHSEVNSIRSIVDDIHSSVSDRYSYDSLASHIDELLSAVNDAKEAAESARYAVESHF